MSALRKSVEAPVNEDNVVLTRELIAPQWRDQIGLMNIESLARETEYSESIGIGKDLGPRPLLDLVLNHGFKHICQEGNICFESELNTSTLMLLKPDVFIEKPLAAILDPVNAAYRSEKEYQSWAVSFSRANEKEKALEDVSLVLADTVRSSSVISDACGVLDELFTNAVFNAPFTTVGATSSQNKDRRNQDTSMPNPHYGEAFMGKDGDRIIVGVRDPFGSLNLSSLFGRIRNCYDQGVENNINMGKGGAGIGSYMVYSASASYYAAINKGFATIICCSIPIKMSNRQRASLPKNIHYTEMSR